MKHIRFLLQYFHSAVLCAFIIGLSGCMSAQEDTSSSETFSVSKESTSFVSSQENTETETIKTISGTIESTDNNLITIKTDQSKPLTFSTAEAEMITGITGLLAGNSVTVTYTEKSDKEIYKVQKIIVTDSEDNLKNAKVLEILNDMTIEEKVNQMIITKSSEMNAQISLSDGCSLGGCILFAADFENRTKEESSDFIKSLQSSSKIPLLIGVDEEGGSVNRISKFSAYRNTPFLSPQELYSQGGFELIKSDTIEKCQLLKGLGINVNFAPVCDIAQSSQDFIYSRTFGGNASDTSEYVQTVVSAMHEEGVVSVLKHFPGYGGSSDTHTGLARDSRSADEFWESDLLPFQAGIQAGAEIVMVSHNIVECFDSERPASISPAIHDLLRNDLEFDGVIITDDLSMDGILDYAGENAAVEAILAGNDLLCCTNYSLQISAVLEAINNGEISEERLDESVKRILKLKIEMGLIAWE